MRLRTAVCVPHWQCASDGSSSNTQLCSNCVSFMSTMPLRLHTRRSLAHRRALYHDPMYCCEVVPPRCDLESQERRRQPRRLVGLQLWPALGVRYLCAPSTQPHTQPLARCPCRRRSSSTERVELQYALMLNTRSHDVGDMPSHLSTSTVFTAHHTHQPRRSTAQHIS